MKRLTPIRNRRNWERGYALLLMMFFLALLVLATAAVAPNILTNGKREKEAEMVWRGRQYTRGIRMYYWKFHKFPTSLDELMKPQNGIRFMRQTYKDPMNGTDGAWRLIYVGPNGQLIGSLKSRSITLGGFGAGNVAGVQAMNSPTGNVPLPGTSTGANSFGNSGFGTTGFGNSGFGNTGFGTAPTTVNQNPPGAPGSDTQNPTGTPGGDTNAPDSSSEMGTPHDLATPSTANIIGGNIIGVGSKINQKSILWYDKAKNYRLFEFIWDPSKDVVVGAASRGIGTPVQNLGGQNPGTTSPFGNNPTQNPQQNQNFNANPNPNDNPPLQAPPPNQ
jgi:hypothetical protein